MIGLFYFMAHFDRFTIFKRIEVAKFLIAKMAVAVLISIFLFKRENI